VPTLATIISANGSTTQAHADLREKEEEKRKELLMTEGNNAVDLASA